MTRSNPKPEEQDDEVLGPAKITDEHAQTRVLSKEAGAKSGWSRLSNYEREFRLGHLFCREQSGVGSEVWSELRAAFADVEGLAAIVGKLNERARDEVKRALARRDAAEAFDEGWKICNASWPSGADMDRIRIVGCPGSFVDHERRTKDFWRRVQLRMGVNDWMICRRVCGEGYKVAETVISIQPGYKDSTLARFREALDALCHVLDTERGVRG